MLFARYSRALQRFRFILKPVVIFDIWASLIFVFFYAPATAWMLNRLVAASGQYALSDTDLAVFLLSPKGFIFLVGSIGFALAFWFAEQVGLFIITWYAAVGKKVSASLVLWENLTRMPVLVRLALLQAAAYLGAAVPFLSGLGLIYWLLLRHWDINYYLTARPATWWLALIVAGVLSAAYLFLAAWLYVRWLFAIPLIAVENRSPMAALATSWRQTKGRFFQLAGPLALWWLAIGLSSAAATWLIRVSGGALLDHIGMSLKTVLPTVVAALALIVVVNIVWLIVGKIVHVALMADFYFEAADGNHRQRSPAAVRGLPSPAALKRIGWLITGVAGAMAIAGGVVFLQGFNTTRTVEITGHRGSKSRAPENTLSALRQAIAEGADYAEIDVQTTADGVLVLFHDADFMRVASLNRRLRDTHSRELMHIDVGSWFAPEFSSERVPTLQEAIDLARGRIRLNIELKFNWPDPELVRKVGTMIRQNHFSSDCVISSLNYQALTQIKAAFPELTTGFIVFKAAGDLFRMETDFLSISAAIATGGLVRRLHRSERSVTVWTVNDFNNVISMLEIGVDNIITDFPGQVRGYLQEWNALSGSEKLALMLRNLIAGIEGPTPSEL
jgi:glycerophosphoryl diester phosphodiesterase